MEDNDFFLSYMAYFMAAEVLATPDDLLLT